VLERAHVALHVGAQGVGKTTAMVAYARSFQKRGWRVLAVVNRRDDLQRFAMLRTPALVSSALEADRAAHAGEELIVWTHAQHGAGLPDADAAVRWASTHGPLLVCVTEVHLYWRPWPAKLAPETLSFLTNSRHVSCAMILDTQSIGEISRVARDAATTWRCFAQGEQSLAALRHSKRELADAAEECARLIAARNEVGWFVEVDPRAPFPPYTLRRF